jgi:hypothetical protein
VVTREVPTSAIDELEPGGDGPELAHEERFARRRLTVARVKLRKFVAKHRIVEAVRLTGIKRSTLLALRAGTVDDPRCSQVLALQRHAGIEPGDWQT